MAGCNKLYLSRVTTTLVKMSNFGGRDSRARASGTETFHVSLFKCPGWKFVGKVRSSRNLYMALYAIVRWCYQLMNRMFRWRSGALPGPRYIFTFILLICFSQTQQFKSNFDCMTGICDLRINRRANTFVWPPSWHHYERSKQISFHSTRYLLIYAPSSEFPEIVILLTYLTNH